MLITMQEHQNKNNFAKDYIPNWSGEKDCPVDVCY